MKMLMLFFWALWYPAWAQAFEVIEKETAHLGNQARGKNGVPHLDFDPTLSAIARRHSEDMLKEGYLGHYSNRAMCRTLRDRLNVGHRFSLTSAENLYRSEGYPISVIAQAAVDSWLASPVHCRNLLNKNYNRVGIGVAGQGENFVFTQVFSFEPVVIENLEVVREADGYLVKIVGLVTQGAPRGALFLEGKRQLDWQAGPDGRFVSEIRVNGPVSLSIGQLVGAQEWAIDTEFPVPPPGFKTSQTLSPLGALARWLRWVSSS